MIWGRHFELSPFSRKFEGEEASQCYILWLQAVKTVLCSQQTVNGLDIHASVSRWRKSVQVDVHCVKNRGVYRIYPCTLYIHILNFKIKVPERNKMHCVIILLFLVVNNSFLLNL